MVLKLRGKWVLKGDVVVEKENINVFFVVIKGNVKMKGLKDISNFLFEVEFEVMMKVLK